MKIISWNINSLRLRLPLLKKLVEEANPDVICLQEIKVQDADFPLLEVKALGYDFVEFSGEKSYNGVAIISKFPLSDVSKIDILDYGHKRHISAKIGDVILHNFYVPAGGDIPDVVLNDKFDHKLKFVDWMGSFFASMRDEVLGSPLRGSESLRSEAKHDKVSSLRSKAKPDDGGKKIIIVGDMNIAPLEHDVWSHKQLLKIVSHTPIEVEKMLGLQQSLDWIDTHRHFVNEKEKLYSWWSYRAKDPLGADKGRRLDHIWVTPNLKDNIKSMNIYKNFRAYDQPSDHVPIETVFSFDE